MKNIKWGIIGLGHIATKFAHAIKSVDNGELVAVASRSKEKSELFGSQFGLQPDACYGNYEDILNHPDLDALYIALPNHLHKEWSIKALNAKKAVLCEKPSTLNTHELKEVLNAAKNNRTFYMEAMKTRFLPATRHVKQLLADHAIGDPRLVYGDFGFKPPFDPTNRLFDQSLGGGALLDVGVYPLAYTFDLFGKESKVFESIQTFGETGVDLDTSVLIKSVDDVHIHLFASIDCDSPRDYIIVGPKGTIRVPRFSNATSITLTQGDIVTEYHYDHLVNGLEYQIYEVNECLNNNLLESPIMSWDDSYHLMSVVDDIVNTKE